MVGKIDGVVVRALDEVVVPASIILNDEMPRVPFLTVETMSAQIAVVSD
jgi:hypothetical protein